MSKARKRVVICQYHDNGQAHITEAFIPPDHMELFAAREEVKSIASEVVADNPEWEWQDIEIALERKGFIAADFTVVHEEEL